jgi:hypothetical protein
MAQAGGPALSVIITAYNGEDGLPRALDSLRAQTFDDFELLIVDNGSTDGTWEFIQALDWRRMRGHRLKARRHEVDAFTQVLAWAQGKYVVHHGAGDVSAPGRFEAQIARMKRGRTLGAVGAYARWVDAEGGTLREIRPPSGHKTIVKWLEREDAEFVLGIARGAAMLNREALEAVGGFRSALGHAAFLDIWLRLAASDYKLANVTTPLYTVHFNPAAPYIRFHAEARAFATLARDLMKGDGDEKEPEKADKKAGSGGPAEPEAATKAAGEGGAKPPEKKGAERDAPPDALKAEAKPPVDRGDEKPGDGAAAEKGESSEGGGEDKPAGAKVDAGGGPPAGKEAVKTKAEAESGAAEQKEKAESEGELEAKKPGESAVAEAAKPPEGGREEKPAEAKVDAEDGPPAVKEAAKTKPEAEAGAAEGGEKGEGEGEPEAKKPGDGAAAEKGEAPEGGGEKKPAAAKVNAEDGSPAVKEAAKTKAEAEAGAAEGGEKGEGKGEPEAKKPGDSAAAEAVKPPEGGEEEKPAGAKVDAKSGPSAGEKPEAGKESGAGAAEGEKKPEAGDKEAKKPDAEDKPVEAVSPPESAEKDKPAKPGDGGKGKTPTGGKPAGAGETSGAGAAETEKKGEARDKEAEKPEKSGPAAADEPEVSTQKMTPVERARRLAAERADRGLAARLRERSDNYLAWAARFDEWGGAAGEHVRQMWTRALLAYPLNPGVWAFAYRRLADRAFGGGGDDAGPEA